MSLDSLLGQPAPIDLKVELTGIGKESGKLHIALYNSDSTFMKTDQVFRSEIIAVKNHDLLSFTLARIPAGKYALALFLDKNGNNKLDMSILGIPKEKYGFSGHKLPLFRAPNFDEAVFDVSDKKNVVKIKLR